MPNSTCWYCFKDFVYEDPQYRDVPCPYCGVENSIYNPADQPLNKEEEVANLGDLRKNLRKEDVQAGDIILFVNAGEIKDVDFSSAQDGSDVKTVFQVLVELPDGKNKVYTPNATTRGLLSDAWGEDTEEWVGKKGKVNLIDQLSFGKMVKVMVLQPVE
jgi:hypothetical protein